MCDSMLRFRWIYINNTPRSAKIRIHWRGAVALEVATGSSVGWARRVARGAHLFLGCDGGGDADDISQRAILDVGVQVDI